jgi:hypothetical protein
MPIKSIEIMCIPCPKCERIKNMITEAIKFIETQNKIKIAYSFQHIPNLKQLDRYSASASQAPIVIINGNVELCGQVTQDVVRRKIEEIQRY